MSKKSFKKDLGNLIQSSSVKEVLSEHKRESNEIDNEYLAFKLDKLSEELYLWRTGILNVDLFHLSLEKHHLKYSQETNDFEKVD